MNPELHASDGGLLIALHEVDPTLSDRLPTHLYHYTTIAALAHILDGHSLKFNRLDQCNDPLEAASTDLNEARTCVFVSCWTEEEQESIPLWGLYSGGFMGVRIKMPTNMFTGRSRPEPYKGGDTAVVLMQECVRINRSGGGSQTRMIHGPTKIVYTDNALVRHVKCIHQNGPYARIALHDLGTSKTSPWSYENEWRFRIYALTDESHHAPGENFDALVDLHARPVESTSLLVPLDSDALNEMVVTLGPKTTLAEEIIVKSLLDRYAPNATLEKSKLAVR